MTQRVNIDLDKGLWHKVGVRAAQEGITKRELTETALKNYLEGEKEMTNKMNWTEIMNKARELANSGTFTDNPEEIGGDVYLVEDMQDVINAFAKDIEEGKLGTHSEPAEFLDRHGIKWQ
ncbi:MAG: hypothetical protein QM401_04950 [Bacillota bacterium]|nr:hypothetical protein [Bacillota bacterium]